MKPSLIRTALVLGLLAAVGPFAIDMYLPAMPAMAADLGAPVASVQATLTAFFLTFGAAQLVWGPLSDRTGRRLPLFLGIALFLVASVGCALAPDAGWLIAMRALQGVGAAVAMVLPRAIIRDMHTGSAATRLMAMVMLVISVSPMLAPLAGSGLIAVADWRAIFVALAVAAALSLGIVALALPETLPPAARVPVRPRALAASAGRLLTDPKFMGLTFTGGFGMASFFVFISSASFVYTQAFGLSPVQFSLAFAVNAIGFFAASQAAAPLGDRYGPGRVVRGGTAMFLVFAGLLLVLALAEAASLAACIACLFLANAGLGVVIPTTMVLALDDHGDAAGMASSLGGTLQMVAGGAMIVLTAPFFDGTMLPMAAAIALCALGSFTLARVTLAAGPRPA